MRCLTLTHSPHRTRGPTGQIACRRTRGSLITGACRFEATSFAKDRGGRVIFLTSDERMSDDEAP